MRIRARERFVSALGQGLDSLAISCQPLFDTERSLRSIS